MSRQRRYLWRRLPVAAGRRGAPMGRTPTVPTLCRGIILICAWTEPCPRGRGGRVAEGGRHRSKRKPEGLFSRRDPKILPFWRADELRKWDPMAIMGHCRCCRGHASAEQNTLSTNRRVDPRRLKEAHGRAPAPQVASTPPRPPRRLRNELPARSCRWTHVPGPLLFRWTICRIGSRAPYPAHCAYPIVIRWMARAEEAS